MFSNLKSAIQKVTSKANEEDEYKGEDIQAVIILLLFNDQTINIKC